MNFVDYFVACLKLQLKILGGLVAAPVALARKRTFPSRTFAHLTTRFQLLCRPLQYMQRSSFLFFHSC